MYECIVRINDGREETANNFKSIEDARAWTIGLVDWINEDRGFSCAEGFVYEKDNVVACFEYDG